MGLTRLGLAFLPSILLLSQLAGLVAGLLFCCLLFALCFRGLLLALCLRSLLLAFGFSGSLQGLFGDALLLLLRIKFAAPNCLLLGFGFGISV